MAKKRRRSIKKSPVRMPSKPQGPKAASLPPVVVQARVADDQYANVGRDAGHIVLITLMFVAVQLVLWQVFARTGIDENFTRLLSL